MRAGAHASAVLLCLLPVLAWTPAFAQAPKVVNAAFEERAVTGPFEAFFGELVRQQAKAAWIAYAVAALSGHQAGCCDEGGWSGPVFLEGRPAAASGTNEQPARPEGNVTTLVLLRVENHQVGKVRVLSLRCPLDAGGLPFTWLGRVVPAESVRVLEALAAADGKSGGIVRSATMAIAVHDDPAADTALEQLVARDQSLELRKQAAFWLGVARGERGYRALRAVADRDPSAEFRRQAVVVLAQSPAPAAVDALIQMARNDPDASVRSQALFWLAQKAGKKAIGTLTEAIDTDPERQVKERAVFALAHLPKDEGVPLLIGLARSNKDPMVRQRAMFWLGQSKDERALTFFEDVLKGR